MWIPGRVMQLPFSLLAASLAIVAVAMPVESSEVDLKVLTPETFTPTIAKGVWFIEHFSPYCSHCKQFMPTWKELVSEIESSPDPGIHLAQVNCAVHGDLCTANKVTGYPSLHLYRDGQFVEQWRKARDHDALLDYLHSKAEPQNPKPLTSSSSSSSSSSNAVADTPRVDSNPYGTSVVLTSGNWAAHVGAAAGPVFVKFYAPWCGHCKKLAPHWARLAVHAQHKLTIAEVDCDAQPKLCKAENVQGYPSLVLYNGGEGTEYTGGRKFDALAAFADKVVAPPVQEVDAAGFEAALKAEPVLFVALLDAPSDALTAALNSAARALLGAAPLYTAAPSVLPALADGQQAPVLLALKDHESSAHAALPLAGADAETIKAWMGRHRFASVTELTQESFKDVMSAPHGPLVVLAAMPKDSASLVGDVERLRAVARQWHERHAGEARDVLFAWMDAERWGSWLKGMYGVVPGAQALVVADHQRLVYWDADASGAKIALGEASIFSALRGAMHGVGFKYSENMLERFARYVNGKLTSMEGSVRNNPGRTALGALGLVLLFAYAVKRFIIDDTLEDAYEHRTGEKGRRLD